jgi:hypothetical protein
MPNQHSPFSHLHVDRTGVLWCLFGEPSLRLLSFSSIGSVPDVFAFVLSFRLSPYRYGGQILQEPGDSFFIPKGQPHAFGPLKESIEPVLVSVLWSPPFHEGYTIPADGCRM